LQGRLAMLFKTQTINFRSDRVFEFMINTTLFLG
jgi:hypothetical protein